MPPRVVTVSYYCHVCGRKLDDAPNLRNHLKSQHRIYASAFPRGKRRYNTNQFTFVKMNGHVIPAGIKERFGCPCCLLHFADIDSSKDHITSVHVGQNNDTAENEETGEQEEDRSEGSDMLPDGRNSVLCSPNTPKLTLQGIKALQPLVMVTTLSNPLLPQQTRNDIITDIQDQVSLPMLKTFEHVFSLLSGMLEQDLNMLPGWLWAQVNEDVNKREGQLLAAAKFILTNFANYCSTSNPVGNSERTYWIRYVVPIFESFAHQTELLTFEWCETRLKQYPLSQVDTKTWKAQPPRFCDGLGFNAVGEEWMPMECSSGLVEEHIEHTINDTAKQIGSQVAILKAIAINHLDASFDTLRNAKVFGIHSVSTTLTLTETSINGDAKFIYKEARMAQVPTSFDMRSKWLRIFEMLAYLLVELEAQQEVQKTLDDEQNGKLPVERENAIRRKMTVT